MSTDESLERDAEQDETWATKLYEGWWFCDCGCGALYNPDTEMIDINGNRYTLQCLKDEYGLVKE